jgi:hypothetical protein
LDLENPRFGLSEAGDPDEALSLLLQRSDLKELWDSFALKGFEPFEPLIGVEAPPEKWQDPATPEYIIIEGNRRLAAAKSMLDPSQISALSKKNVPQLPDRFRESLEALPVYIVPRREDAYDYIGFKHINGPSSWGSLAKAKFGVLLFEQQRGGLADQEVLYNLSKKLGDSPSQVLRTLVAYKIFEQAIRLEMVPDPASSEVQVDFSHLYTMLPNPSTRKYLGLGERPLQPDQIVENPIPETHHDKLKQFMGWLFGTATSEPVIQRQGTDRPALQKVLASEAATQTLETTGDFEQAVQEAGFAKDNWLSNVVKLQSLSSTVFSSLTEMTTPLTDEEREKASDRLRKTRATVERILKVF